MARYCPYCMSIIQDEDHCTECSFAQNYQPKPHHLRPGSLLNRKYLVGRVLGEGGFGITYVGRDLMLDMKVAIKEYYPNGMVTRISTVSTAVSLYDWTFDAAFKQGREQFIEEARTMAKMDKESAVVTVRDFFEENGSAYIVMEFVEGRELKDLVAESGKPFESGELLPLLEPLFGALTELHEIGLIHRDISPDNVMLENGRARLIDFGCARESFIGSRDADAVLKHGFSPIEQYDNRDLGPWTDVYAMGATIYYCLTGKLPPKATERVLKDTMQRPTALGAKLSARQENALMKALALKREERWQSMEEFGKELFVHKKKYGWAVVSALLVLLIAAGVWYGYQKAQVQPETVYEVVEAKETKEKEKTVTLNMRDPQVSEEERALLETISTQVESGALRLSKQNRGSHYYMLDLSNMTGENLEEVAFNVLFYNRDNAVFYDTGDSFSEWKAAEEKSANFYCYLADGDPERAEIQVVLKSGNREIESDYMDIPFNYEGKQELAVQLVNRLPATISCSTFTCTIDSFEVYSLTDLGDTMSASIYLGGEVKSVSSRYMFIYFRIRDERGAEIERSYNTISLSNYQEGDRFAHLGLYLDDLPKGSLKIELYAE